jgi:hypothetical protein
VLAASECDSCLAQHCSAEPSLEHLDVEFILLHTVLLRPLMVAPHCQSFVVQNLSHCMGV